MSRRPLIAAAIRNQRGAVDLPSIMVGAIVLGLLTAAILATVFTVIPWAQDSAAKQKVSQIVSAQSAYYAMNSQGHPHYGSVHSLVDQNLLSGVDVEGSTPPSGWWTTSTSSRDGKIRIDTTNATTLNPDASESFRVTVSSDTGHVYEATQDDPHPRRVTGG